MVVNTLKEFAGVQHEHAVYIKDANALLRIYRESVAVVDLTNAMQAGKTCKKYSFIFANADNGISGLVNFLDDLAFADFVNYCRVGNYAENSERLEIIGVKYHESELKACRVASPFAKVKKQYQHKNQLLGYHQAHFEMHLCFLNKSLNSKLHLFHQLH